MFLKDLSGKRKIFFIFAALFLTFLFVSPALADSTNYYKPLVQIPGMPTGDVSLTQYLSTLYNFLISIVGILAMAVIIYGGMRYMISAGNPAAMEDAKETIMSAVYGLALALGSWLVINVVNPDILVLKNPGVGLPGGGYAYKESSTLRCFDNPGNPDVYDPGEGTQSNPCTCLDGTSQYSTKTRTSITLNVAPSSVSVGGTVTASGTLTDASGAKLGGKSISIIVSNPAVNGSGLIPSTGGLLSWLGLGITITTDINGNFSVPLGPSHCVATEQWQAVFWGDTAYLPTGSGIVSVTTNQPGTSCTQGDYPGKTAATFMSPGTCQNLCSNKNAAYDGLYHCLLPKLGVGKSADDASSGNQRIDSAPAKVGEPVYFDAITNTRHTLPIGKIEIDLQPNIADWLLGSTYEYTCIIDPACGTVGGCDPSTIANGGKWDPPTPGKLTYKYTTASTYPVALRISLKDPSTGNCDIRAEDKNAIIKIEP